MVSWPRALVQGASSKRASGIFSLQQLPSLLDKTLFLVRDYQDRERLPVALQLEIACGTLRVSAGVIRSESRNRSGNSWNARSRSHSTTPETWLLFETEEWHIQNSQILNSELLSGLRFSTKARVSTRTFLVETYKMITWQKEHRL